MDMNFESLVTNISTTQQALQNNARLVINRHVTVKAWLTGYYIVEYEQNGADRAKYGERLLQNIAERLNDKKTFSYRSLRLYRQFYLTYKCLDTQVGNFLLSLEQKGQTVSANFQLPDNVHDTNWQSVIAKSASTSESNILVNPELLFNKLSFAHLSQLLPRNASQSFLRKRALN